MVRQLQRIMTNRIEYHVGLPFTMMTTSAAGGSHCPLQSFFFFFFFLFLFFFFSWEGEAREAAKGKIRATDKSISYVPEHAKDIVPVVPYLGS